MTAELWELPTILRSENLDLASAALRKYFDHQASGVPYFSGSRFELFAGGGDTHSANVFTADDLVAVTMLNVNIPAQAALRILGDDGGDYAGELSTNLALVPVDVDLVDATDSHLAVADDLWTLLRTNRHVGQTKASKLLARKRPRMFPVIDRVVKRELGHGGHRTDFFATLRAQLNDNDRALWNHLALVRKNAGVGDEISIIRCFDIVVWMAGAESAA